MRVLALPFALRASLLVAAGGAVGSLARFWLSYALPREPLPWGTVAVNALGSFAVGFLLLGLVARGLVGDDLRHLLILGFLGGFTTMSAFAAETSLFLQEGRVGLALAAFVLNPLVSLAAAGLGLLASRAV